MVKYPKKDYKFLRFEKSKRKGKKYDAILQNKQTKREVRKRSYRSRHSKEIPTFREFYSPGFFAMKYLWT